MRVMPGEDHFANRLLEPLGLRKNAQKDRAAPLLKELVEKHFGHFPRGKIPQLHHYTRASGLTGFLSSTPNDGVDAYHRESLSGEREGADPRRTFRASLATHLNDFTELRHGQQLIWKRFQSFAKEAGVKRVLDRLRIPWSTLLNPKVPWTNIFVVCFTELEDSLGQWRGYGGVRGYSLTFDVGNWPSEVLLARVRYDDRDSDLRATLERLLAFYEKFGRDASPTGIAASLRRGLALAAAVHKQPEWKDEKEWRLLWWCEQPQCVRFREGAGRLIPYHLVPLPEAFRLRSITYGPGFEKLTEMKALAMLKESFRLDRTVNLKGTKITLRLD